MTIDREIEKLKRTVEELNEAISKTHHQGESPKNYDDFSKLEKFLSLFVAFIFAPVITAKIALTSPQKGRRNSARRTLVVATIICWVLSPATIGAFLTTIAAGIFGFMEGAAFALSALMLPFVMYVLLFDLICFIWLHINLDKVTNYIASIAKE